MPLVEKQRGRYDVEWQPNTIAGVYTEVFTPKGGIPRDNRDLVLLNLHGGGFIVGGRSVGRIESIPIAATARVKVISIDYRMAPEARFPAASEDVAAVYREILKDHRPSNVGIYGCSAGGLLPQLRRSSWFQKENLPPPGAVGIFCASTHGFLIGDSGQLAFRIGESGGEPPVTGAQELAGDHFRAPATRGSTGFAVRFCPQCSPNFPPYCS